MASWSILKAAIKQYIKANGNREITGPILQSILNNIVSSVGANATLVGIATPTTNPGTPDGPVFYLASENGTYLNFGNIILTDEAAILVYSPDTSLWTKFAITRGDFISSSHDDTAEGLITFEQGLIAKDKSTFTEIEADKIKVSETITTKNIEASDTITTKNIEASDTITTKNLEVTGSAHFFQLIIDQIRSVGGRIILSLASCEVAYVEYLDSNLNILPMYYENYVRYFRVYFCANDGDNKVTNNFAIGDLAIAMTFNVGEGRYSNVSNKYYWRAVKNCSYSALTYSFDNFTKKYYYIDLYNNDSGYYDTNSNSIPAVGDTIVQLGSINNDSRASAIILSAYNDNWLDTGIKAPCIAQYIGIGREAAYRFDLAHYRYTWFSLNDNEIKGNLKVVTSSGTQDIVDYVDGEITSTKALFTVENEKITASVESVSNRADTLNGELNGLKQTVEINKSSIEQRADSIALSVESAEQSINTLNGELNGLTQTVDNIPNSVKTQSQLDLYTSSIKQSAKEIALEVSQELDVRKNLLPGTDFTLWDETKFNINKESNNKSATIIILTSDTMLNGCNSIEVSNTKTAPTYPGIIFSSIPVTKDKNYFISTYIKKVQTITVGTLILVQHISDEDGASIIDTTPATYSNNNMPDNQWTLFGSSFKAKTNYVNIIICQVSNGTFRITLPMLEEGSSRTIWTKSDKDYYHIGGNLIPNSKTLTKVVGNNDGITGIGTKKIDTDGNAISEVTAKATYDADTDTWTPAYKFPLTIRQTFNIGTDYVLSFYIRRTSGPSTNSLTINLNKNILYSELYTGQVSRYSKIGGTTPHSGYQYLYNVPTEWTRVWLHFRVYIENENEEDITSIQISSINAQVYANTEHITLQLKQPKLEIGAYPTEWTEYAESIEEYDVANQLKKTGIDITQGTIKLSADKTIIDGDLHLRGILVENYAEKARNSLVICDLIRNKSVSVTRSLLILPMITKQEVSIYTGGTPEYYPVNAVTEAGVKLTIAAKYEPDVAKWSSATAELYARYTNSEYNVMEVFHSYATIVFADPRIASIVNYTGENAATILPEGGGGIKASGYEGGVFICNGRRGRILLLMPGQTLHLTSAIETINGTDHLLWYVDNGSEFTSLQKYIVFDSGDYLYEKLFKSNGGNAWPMEVEGSSGSEYQDSLFGPKQLDNNFSNTNVTLNIRLTQYE